VRYAVFSERSFAALIRPNDSTRFDIDLKLNREQIIQDAVVEANSGNPILQPYTSTVSRGKTYVSYERYTDHLVLRAIVRHIARRYRVEVPTRDEIVRGVIEGLMDATPMHLVRRDIKSFYENIPIVDLKRKLTTDTRTSKRVKQYLDKFFEQHCTAPVGLPRGIGLSAVIAELHMKEFDQAVRRIPQVYRYYRYCDDIFIFLLSKPRDIDSILAPLLPPGMKFNPKKSLDHEVGQGGPECTVTGIEYLGYRFSLSGGGGGKATRKVEVGIGERKIGRLKARIIASFQVYQKDRNFSMLLDRIRYLSSNYIVYRNNPYRKSSSHVRSGIFYNYKLAGVYTTKYGTELSIDVSPLSELKSVDGFYHSLLSGPSSGFSALLASSLRAPQMAELQKLSFHKGHSLRMLVRYRPQQVASIKRAWQNV